jgi:hypothetical protein
MTTTPYPIAKLTIHPAAEALPMPAVEDPASRAIVASICDLGRVLEPLKICQGRVVDGRIRLRGALAAGLPVAPVTEITEAEVAEVILHTLLARRHYTKSALAYLGFPLFETALAESRKRRLANLRSAPLDAKPGTPIPESKSVVSASKPRSSTQWTIGETAEELADALGVSRSLFFMAREVRKKFATGPKILRDTWEPKLLSGELSLGEVQQAVSGKLAALDGQTNPKNDPQQLLFDLFRTATARFGRWSALSPAQRKAATQKFRDEFLPSLPPDLLEEVESFLSERLATA